MQLSTDKPKIEPEVQENTPQPRQPETMQELIKGFATQARTFIPDAEQIYVSVARTAQDEEGRIQHFIEYADPSKMSDPSNLLLFAEQANMLQGAVMQVTLNALGSANQAAQKSTESTPAELPEEYQGLSEIVNMAGGRDNVIEYIRRMILENQVNNDSVGN